MNDLIPIKSRCTEVMSDIYYDYWPTKSALDRQILKSEVTRTAFHLFLISGSVRPGGVVCDLGGGWGALAAGCARSGFTTFLVDDFRDAGFSDSSDRRHGLADKYGFFKLHRDLISEGIDFDPESVHAFTSFDSLEHWHHSPKSLLRQIMISLRPGGLFLLGVPNCVNLRKRISGLIGKNKWSSMTEWYETPKFRGHVREPDIEDLRYIASDLGLVNCHFFGRNWLGYVNANCFVRSITPWVDRALRLVPSLCSDIYLLGYKPNTEGRLDPPPIT